MKGYLFLTAAIIFELLGTTCMKISDGFENKIYAAGTLIFYGVCFYFFSLSLKTVDLNVAYATWGGLGITLAAAVAYFFFHETVTPLGLLGIVFIVIGVVLCNFFGAAH